MILLGLGGNLPIAGASSPVDNLEVALAALVQEGVGVVKRSRWYRTAPIADQPQPWYVNGVAELDTELSPDALMELLLTVERRFGRVRTVPNAPRTIDLDLLAYRDIITPPCAPIVTLPHPRLHERAFVLVPLVEIAPAWRHPVLRCTAHDLLAGLPTGQEVELVGEGTVADRTGLG